MSALTDALQDDATGTARLRDLLAADLARSERELAQRRSGYDQPVVVAVGCAGGVLVAGLPLPAAFRADAAAIDERAWLVAAAAVAALQEAAGVPAPARAEDLRLRAGEVGPALALGYAPGDPELAVLAFEEAIAGVDRLRARAVALPDGVLDPHDLRPPVGAAHPLAVAEAVARLGGDPADPQPEHEEAVLALLGVRDGPSRPHEDPDPARRAARRILQRLDGMGKWGGYHTEFVHLARGFAGNDRALAERVGEALIEAELLLEKPSVGQRHVFLNPRRARDIRALIEEGTAPAQLRLPRT